ncbi:DUF397 domain-containing protein [Streptomyces sp. NRRL B-1347]|uniref:DUF397 domain-containing protein n=1 Tax=Streptomyces sp. NRRL B-1347 TaxID=1476877 RepID=UPI0004C4CA72|nr:DUF397 domain-containing protein [Streptomyces sp. NRRL B-1347]
MREYDLSNALWRKSSYSGGDGGEDCVEVAYDFVGAARWHKSSYSSGDGGENCVEVATSGGGVVPVRDSKVQGGPALVIGARAWRAFIRGVAR